MIIASGKCPLVNGSQDSREADAVSTDPLGLLMGYKKGRGERKPRLVVCMDTSNGINLEEWAYAIASHGQGRVFPISANTIIK